MGHENNIIVRVLPADSLSPLQNAVRRGKLGGDDKDLVVPAGKFIFGRTVLDRSPPLPVRILGNKVVEKDLPLPLSREVIGIEGMDILGRLSEHITLQSVPVRPMAFMPSACSLATMFLFTRPP